MISLFTEERCSFKLSFWGGPYARSKHHFLPEKTSSAYIVSDTNLVRILEVNGVYEYHWYLVGQVVFYGFSLQAELCDGPHHLTSQQKRPKQVVNSHVDRSFLFILLTIVFRFPLDNLALETASFFNWYVHFICIGGVTVASFNSSFDGSSVEELDDSNCVHLFRWF